MDVLSFGKCYIFQSLDLYKFLLCLFYFIIIISRITTHYFEKPADIMTIYLFITENNYFRLSKNRQFMQKVYTFTGFTQKVHLVRISCFCA